MLKRRILSILLVLAMLVPTAFASQHAQDNMRGVWVASVYNIDYPSTTGLSADTLAAEADTMLDNIAAMGLNTVFLQVRPSADALYKSSLFPQSRYVSGACGAAPDGDFDVLAYWVEGAHKRGLQLHAWVNPYRITKDGKDELDALPESSPARQHPEWVVQYENNYYFDPGLPAVQQLVVDGAAEIVRNYDVDGIHLDDYFYPGTDFNDAETYARYGEKFDDIDDWRRDNVNTLIASLDETLHAINPDLSFGRTSPSPRAAATPTASPRTASFTATRSNGFAAAQSITSVRSFTGPSATRPPTSKRSSTGGRRRFRRATLRSTSVSARIARLRRSRATSGTARPSLSVSWLCSTTASTFRARSISAIPRSKRSPAARPC